MASGEARPKGTGPDVQRDNLFELDSVKIAFPTANGERTVIEGLNLTVKAGEFLTIVGGSGTGKTTLLRLLGGLGHCTSGSVMYRGAPVQSVPEGVVMVFQDYANSLLPWRSARENIELGMASRKLTKPERRDKVEQMLALVGLEHAADQFPWQLSGGMQQRVQLARALAMDPSVLLMDEPFGALDAITRAGLQDELARIQAVRGTTTIFITHDVEESIYLGDRVLVLGGRPAHVIDEVAVNLPHPRTQVETRGTEQFIELRNLVHRSLDHTT